MVSENQEIEKIKAVGRAAGLVFGTKKEPLSCWLNGGAFSGPHSANTIDQLHK